MVTIDWRIFWEVFNFLVLLWLLKKYLYGPITAILDQRQAKIKADLQEAVVKKEEAEKLKQEYEAELQQARAKAQEIIEDAEQRSKEKAREIIAEARSEAARIREQNAEEIQRAKEEALTQVKKELASLSIMIAGKFLQEKLQQQQDEKLIEQYIQQLDRQKLGERP